RLEVRDSGPGLSEEAQARLFQPFSQVDSSTTRRHGGTGLGLAISRQLVELMNGRIGVSSTPGNGSTFWFTAVFGRVSTSAARSATTPSTLRGRRVLVVDDAASTRRVLCGLLERWGALPQQVSTVHERSEERRVGNE